MKRSISVRALQKWMAYYRIEPFGDEWGRTALSTLLIVKALGAGVSEDFRDRFLPSFDPDREMTPDEIEAEMMKCPGAKIEATE